MNRSQFAVVVAADAANGIGRDGGLPWHLRGDLAHFRRITSAVPDPRQHNAVLMGRRTWDSIPEKYRPLQERSNVVISSLPAAAFPPEVTVAGTFEAALAAAHALPDLGGVFVIGGEQLFRDALAHRGCARVYLTRIEGDFGCDRFLPPLGPEWRRLMASDRHAENGIGFRFEVWAR